MLEFDKEGAHGGFLLWGAGVGCFAVGIKTAFVTDSDAMLVVVQTMGSDLGFWASSVDAAIAVDDVVVADAFPTSGFVPAVNLFYAGGLIGTDGTAVDY